MIYTKIHENRHFPSALLTFGVGIVISLSVYILPAFAREAFPPLSKETPEEFKKIQEITGRDVTSTDGKIFDYLDDTMCGGWMYEQSAEGKIARIKETPLGETSTVEPGNIIPSALDPPPGLPGRKGQWDGNIPSGMARREDEFMYPYAAEGYSFAHYEENPVCDLIFATKSVLGNPEQEFCKDQNQQPPEKNAPQCNADCEFLNNELYQYPVQRVKTCLHVDYIDYEVNGVQVQERIETPYETDSFQTEVGLLSLDAPVIEKVECNSCLPGDEVTEWEYAGQKFTCTGHIWEEQTGILLVPYGWVWGDQGKSKIKIPEACIPYLVQEPTEYPNCTSCGVEDRIVVEAGHGAPINSPWEKSIMAPGQECRCEGEGCGISIRTDLKSLNDLTVANPFSSPDFILPPRTVDYKSFYRQYLGKYERDALPTNIEGVSQGDEDEIIEKEGRVGCYGWYEEFDPLVTAHTDEKQSCVIDIYGEDPDQPLKDQMRKTQNIRGAYGQVSIFNNPDPNDPENTENQRKINEEEFNEEEHLWYPKLSGGHSFLNERVFDEKLDKNLSVALLDLEAGAHKATVQLSTEKPLAEHSLMRAFDDTVTNDEGPASYQSGKPPTKQSDRRTIVEWWQDQETEANKIFSPPYVRLLLPAKWAAGLDPSDPLFNPAPVIIDRGRDSRTQAIEVQIHAREDLVGEVVAYLERSLLFKTVEEAIPVVVPMGSPTEFRSLATQWCTWWINDVNKDKPDDEKIQDCEGAPVAKIRDRLNEYADRIEETRKLRAELALYLGQVLESQRNILLPITTWFEANVIAYKSFLEERQKVFAEPKEGEVEAENEGLFLLWQSIQKQLWEFHDSVNFPWCMNQRFTTSIYSLLDPWMPGRWKEPIEMDGGRRCTESKSDTPDPSNRYPFCLPVLKLNGDEIPRAEDAVFDLSLFKGATTSLSIPVLKPILLKIDEKDLAPPPPGRDPKKIPELPELPRIDRIQQIIRKGTGQLFPKSETRSIPSVMQAPTFLDKPQRTHLKTMLKDIGAMIRAMTGAYDAFWESLKSHERIECKGESCVHVEMDLIERFTRIGSRPAVHLKEDFESGGTPRTDPNTCPPNDQVCLFLNREKRYPGEGWQIIPPEKNDQKEKGVIQKLREEARKATLPRPIGDQDPQLFEFYDTNKNDLLPPFDIPADTDLTPYPDLVPEEQ
ncbi:hypothetical protein A2635_04535 [Candidatus Peribacteria bacterium RIFCSPHIGHO2_01_FULL_51_9]|nr:MAG: hypothetical protein A2635_04535 [Candidatus Peribacteria bacterium RIFCSPHIGHO2_01_FULL_51_9]